MHSWRRGYVVVAALALMLGLACEAWAGEAVSKVGVARADITPQGPIRLTGYGNRTEEATEVLQPLQAKALAIETADGTLSILMTVDLLGVSRELTEALADRLKDRVGLQREHLAICATHTHTGPMITDVAPAIFGGPLPDDQQQRVDAYTRDLLDKLETLALDAIEDRREARLAWGQGSVDFAVNRRHIVDGRWAGWTAIPNVYVDHDMPLLAVKNPDGTLRAVLVNYACHCTTLVGAHNDIHGDWAGEAAARIEASHEGVVAMIAIGCGADANPEPRGSLEHVALHGQTIADEVERVLSDGLTPLEQGPHAKLRRVDLPFAPITHEELEQRSRGGHFAYSASLFLEQAERGEPVPTSLSYPIQLWQFGDDLAMFFLAGEVVADYAIRMKAELDGSRVWMNAYVNESPSYIVSQRIIAEGGYEVDDSMAYYHQPNRYQPVIEQMIVEAMREMVDEAFERRWQDAQPAELKPGNQPRLVTADDQRELRLHAEVGTPYGPRIEYMPEQQWQAFGWWTDQDYVAWDIQVDQPGEYKVHKTWSVADDSAQRPYLLEIGDQRLRDYVRRTGSWEIFETRQVGTVHLEEGRHRLKVKPAGAFGHGGLMDLREIRLVPVD
ncbi:MAG: neutral/alkaline non-lysosomal ceramidase N-terminal domain-containing protein [Phycisphaeraceae bacterium]